nr:DUF2805 domain-containing protein [Cyanothece sp. BG0011]
MGKQPELKPETISRIIEMAWEDRTPLLRLRYNMVFQKKKSLP